VLDDEMSSIEDIQTDFVRNDKGNVCQSIDNCMTVFQRDPLLKSAIRKNELSGKIDIVGEMGWERTSCSVTDTDVYQLHWYLEKQYGLQWISIMVFLPLLTITKSVLGSHIPNR